MVTSISFALSLLLVFRTNAAYGRFAEAREVPLSLQCHGHAFCAHFNMCMSMCHARMQILARRVLKCRRMVRAA